MRKLWRILPGVLLLGLALTGCKPAEKHYRSAYDMAQAKREASKTDADGLIPSEGLQPTEGPKLRDVDGEQIYVLSERIRTEGEELGECNVAVALYSMDTNANALADNLRGEGYTTTVAVNGDGKHYVIAAMTRTIGEAAQAVREFERRHRDFPYSGLPGAPVVVLK